MIKVVFFDFSGTLVEGKFDLVACRRSVVQLLTSKGMYVTLEAYNRAMEESLTEVRRSKTEDRELSFGEVEAKTLKTLGIVPSRDLLDEIEDVEFEHYDWRVKPEVRTVLRELHRHRQLGIISNGLSNSARKVLGREKLLHYFDPVVISKDVGFRKPNSRIFEYALNKIGVKPENAVFVGDSYAQDVLGAKQAGMKAVWLADERNWSLRSFDAVASNLSQVPGIVAEIESPSPAGYRTKRLAPS